MASERFGKFGNAETALEPGALFVYTTHPRLVPRLLAIPGVRRYQIGDREARLRFPVKPASLRAVCEVIRVRLRRPPMMGNPAALAIAFRARRRADGMTAFMLDSASQQIIASVVPTPRSVRVAGRRWTVALPGAESLIHSCSVSRILYKRCSIVGDSSLSDSRIIRLIGSSGPCTILRSVRSPSIWMFRP